MLENTKESVKRVECEEGKWDEGSKILLILFFVINLVDLLEGRKKEGKEGRKLRR